MMNVSSYPFTKTVEFRISDENNTLKGVTICGPGRDSRRYYAVKPEMGEKILSVEVLEEALDILRLFNKEGYNFLISDIIPATIKEITNC